MKQLILILLLGTSIFTFAQKEKSCSVPLSNFENNSSIVAIHPAISRSPSQLPSRYFRDANSKLIEEDNINSLSADKTGTFYRMNERAKRFPENNIQERLYRDSKDYKNSNRIRSGMN
ncbi:MAG TPA: hypothetical protein VK590_03470 [Saprospiraceae bacterium]|nr:hypothetical protein [Saprospiraceae bacterium]